MTNYCLHPDQCGIGQDCSECHQNHVQQLKAEMARMREVLIGIASRENSGNPYDPNDHPDPYSMIEEAKEAIKEGINEIYT